MSIFGFNILYLSDEDTHNIKDQPSKICANISMQMPYVSDDEWLMAQDENTVLNAISQNIL